MPEEEIILSPKYGLNPSLMLCPVCMKNTTGIALYGKLKGRIDKEAPKYVVGNELCNDCKQHLDNGNIFIIEIKNNTQDERTGRLIGLSKDFKERNNIEHSIMYMYQSEFEQMFGDCKFK